MRIVKEKNIERFLSNLYDYSTKHKGNDYAAEVLMSFLRGECLHLPDKDGRCELCGTKRVQN